MRQNTPDSRCYGIDLYKATAIFFVLILHVLGRGGVLGAAAVGSGQYWMAWAMEVGAYCSVNCFAMATGYLMTGRPFRYRKIIPLWLTVFFYTAVLTGIGAIFFPGSVTLAHLRYLFPVTSAEFWYFTSYCCLFFFLPFLNLLVESMTKRQHCALLLTGFLLFCITNLLPWSNDCFQLVGGYSAWWLIYLYLFGAGIQKYRLFHRLSAAKALLGYLAMIGLTLFVKFAALWVKLHVSAAFAYESRHLIRYISPTILISTVFWLIFCLKVKLPRALQRLLARIAPLIFQVYLIHVHFIPWEYVMHDRFKGYVLFHPLAMAALVLLTALAIFTVCLLMDSLRLHLFRLLQVNRSVDRAADWIREKWSRFLP